MTTYLIDAGITEQLNPISEQFFRNDFKAIQNCPPALQRAIGFICEHYTDPLSLSDVSSRAFISSSHLSYLFRKHLGLRFKNLLCELRIRKSISLLHRNPRVLITELSLQSGFFDLSHFEKMFRRYTNMTPREYRDLVRSNIKLTDEEGQAE